MIIRRIDLGEKALQRIPKQSLGEFASPLGNVGVVSSTRRGFQYLDQFGDAVADFARLGLQLRLAGGWLLPLRREGARIPGA